MKLNIQGRTGSRQCLQFLISSKCILVVNVNVKHHSKAAVRNILIILCPSEQVVNSMKILNDTKYLYEDKPGIYFINLEMVTD